MPETVTVKTGVWDLIWAASPLVQLVMLGLLLMSALCWGIVAIKLRRLKIANRQNHDFMNTFKKSRSFDDIYARLNEYEHSNVAVVFKSGYRELQKLSAVDNRKHDLTEIQNIDRALGRATVTEITSLESHLTWLASTASAAPFIGLFGTVWGIMNSFQEIGATGSANLAVVAPGISEALIATAIGLAAAIPAAIFYNMFINRIKHITVDMDAFSQDFLNIVQRGMMSGSK